MSEEKNPTTASATEHDPVIAGTPEAAGASPAPKRRGRRTAVVAAVANGMCEKGRDVTVRAAGGDLVVNYTDEKITLTGDAKLVYTGEAEY